jgi:hypothetical protein
MPLHFSRRVGVLTLLAGVLTFLPACGKQERPGDGLVRGQTIRGIVTYQGQPVPYGVVLFYSFQKSTDPRTGLCLPSGVGIIQPDGTYVVEDAAAGPSMVCVAADPDVDLGSLARPAPMGGLGQVGAPTDPPGGRRPSAPPDGPRPQPPAGPAKGPSGELPTGPPGGLRHGPPGRSLSDVAAKLPNPIADQFTADQKKMLMEVHAKYGAVGKSGIGYPVREGEQTFDIELK